MSKDLVIYQLDKARAALVKAETIQETKTILDVASAAEILAKRQKLGDEAINYATAIKIEALAQLGRMLGEMPKNRGAEGIGTSAVPKENRTPTLADMGLDKKTSKLAQDISKLPEKELDKVKRGVVTLAKAQRNIKKKKRKKEIEKQKKDIESGKAKLPEGKFEVIMMDVAWPYGTKYEPEGRRVANPYPEMGIDEILSLDVPSADDSILFFWTTHKFLPDSFEIVKRYGFEYKAMLVWDKEKMGMGHWARMQCEFCLLGVKGNPIWEVTDFRDIFKEKRREHSRKPEFLYEFINKNLTGRKLDYFSRQQRKGWENYGNEPAKF